MPTILRQLLIGMMLVCAVWPLSSLGKEPVLPERKPFFFRPGERPSGPFQGMNFSAAWTPSSGDQGMGLSEYKISASFALPAPRFSSLSKSFFIVSPGFSYTSVDWKTSGYVPDSLYNAGLAVTWMNMLSDRWSLMVNATPCYSGDGKASHDTVRCPVMFGASWTPSNRWKVVFGVAYLDRSDLPFMPFAGFTYTPNDCWKIELMAPQARIARRFDACSSNTADRWLYIGGGFGGGTWAIESFGGYDDLAMYREYSLLFGCESVNKRTSFKWNAEIGWLFGRKMKFDNHTQPDQHVDDSIVFRVRCSF